MRNAAILALGLVFVAGGCKEEFDPVKSFNGHVQRFRVLFESKLPESCSFEWYTDINISKTDSITKPWTGTGISVKVAFDSFRRKYGKAWTEGQREQIVAGDVPTRTVVSKKRTKEEETTKRIKPVETEIIRLYSSVDLAWFYSKNDNAWHLAGSTLDNYAATWFDPFSKKEFHLIGVAVLVDTEMQE